VQGVLGDVGTSFDLLLAEEWDAQGEQSIGLDPNTPVDSVPISAVALPLSWDISLPEEAVQACRVPAGALHSAARDAFANGRVVIVASMESSEAAMDTPALCDAAVPLLYEARPSG